MTAPSLPAEAIAEGERLLAAYDAARTEFDFACACDEWAPGYHGRVNRAAFAMRQAEDLIAARFKRHLPALLRAASKNVSLREQVVSANEQRDAAVREVERLREALKFYSEGFIPRPAKRNKYGLNPGLEWKPSEALLDDCGNVAMEALASAAQGGANG